MKLTDEQINEVINWMNKLEQLKGTAIPIRFKEDFANQFHNPDIGGSFHNPNFGIDNPIAKGEINTGGIGYKSVFVANAE